MKYVFRSIVRVGSILCCIVLGTALLGGIAGAWAAVFMRAGMFAWKLAGGPE